MQGSHPNPPYAALPSSALAVQYLPLTQPTLNAAEGLAAYLQGVPIKQGTAGWHAARSAVTFTASRVGVMLGFHGNSAASLLGECATVRTGGNNHAAAAYQQLCQPSQPQHGPAMQWGSNHEVCGKLTAITTFPPSTFLQECGFQATPADALQGLLTHGMLGALPDGMAVDFNSGTCTAVEIKCSFPFQDNDKHGYRWEGKLALST